MAVGVLDSGVALGWLHRRHRSLDAIERLFEASGAGKTRLLLSIVNLPEVLRHAAEAARASGADPLIMLQSRGVEIHRPDEVIARRVARLSTSLADGFALATALVLGARLHTSDRELAASARRVRATLTAY